MKFEYSYVMGLPRKLVWKWMRAEDVIRKSIKGCTSLTEKTSGEYEGEIDIQLGPIKDVFRLNVSMIKEVQPSLYLLRVIGSGKIGEIQGESEIHLKDSEGATKITVKSDIEATGSVALATNRILKAEANHVINSFFQRLETEIKRAIYLARKKV